MIIRPRRSDLAVVGLYTGKIATGTGLLMLIPLATSLLVTEWNTAVDFAIGLAVCLAFGYTLQIAFQTTRDLTWAHGLVVVGVSWLAAVTFGALPLWLSGHFGSYLDATFDVMSGFTTTGLLLVQDLDHLSHGANMWRHLIIYAGGQGIIVMALSFLLQGTAGAFKVYVGEGRDERILPNIVQTARAIWLVALVYLGIGSLALGITGIVLGQGYLRGMLHGLWVFMAGWGTGGFTPQSYNTMYYHSLVYELITLNICIAGSFNFALHWAVWNGNRAEIRRNIEVRSFFTTCTVAMVVTTLGLLQHGAYGDIVAVFRKMFYLVVSGHTGTGFATVYARSFVRQWGAVAMLGVTFAMTIGGGACSTCGGFKGIRVGLIFKGFTQYVRRILSPENARVVEKYHHLQTRLLDDGSVRMAMFIVLCYTITYTLGGLIGTFYGYDFVHSLFESVSATSNTGLSSGITDPSMPTALKLVYIVQMWAGRLEFISLFALGGYVVALFRGK
jgi:trk system potassium uptake protein TrkH